MSAVMIAIFSSFSDAESVLTELIRDGFPTGRVKLTAKPEKGRGGRQAPESSYDQYEKYFERFFAQTGDRAFVEELATRVASGRIVAIEVHPHSEIETSRATEIPENQGALRVAPHELESAGLPETSSWLEHLFPEYPGAAGRLCLRSPPDADAKQ
jgi:hypothetical protein